MSHQSTASVRLWLIATLFALGVLVPLGAAQDAANNTFAAGHSLLQNDPPAAGLLHHVATPAKESLVPAHLQHASHALPRTSLTATLSRTASIVAPAFFGDLAASEHGAALGDAPRASGPSRAPPTA